MFNRYQLKITDRDNCPKCGKDIREGDIVEDYNKFFNFLIYTTRVLGDYTRDMIYICIHETSPSVSPK